MAHRQAASKVRWEKEIAAQWWKLDLAPEEFASNREVVMSAILQDGLALRHASPELQKDWSVVAQAVCRDGEALQYAIAEHRADARLARWAMGLRDVAGIEEWTGPDLSEFNTLATSRRPQPNAIRHAAEQLRADADLMLYAIKEFWFCADHVAMPLRDSWAFWRKVIESSEVGWQAFGSYAPTHLREDETLVDLAVQRDALALRFAGPALRKRRAFVERAVARDWRALGAADEAFRTDAEFLYLAARQSLEALQFAKGDLGDIARRAAQPPAQQAPEEQEAWTGLQDVEETERRNKKRQEVKEQWNALMQKLSETHGRALSYMRVTGVDREMTLEAVKKNGVAFAYAEDELREDRDLINRSVEANIGFCSGLIWREEVKPPEEVDDLQDDVPMPERERKAKGKAKRPKSATKEHA
ncbi:unnamed protein product [Effrenium voratum]|nr:unnamed protein product [Effrenium voratum]